MNGWMVFLRAEWDRVAGWLLIAAGLLCVLLAYRGVADSTLVAQQLAYIASGGLGGLLLGGVGVGLLVSADIHDEGRKLDRIAELLGDSPDEAGRATQFVLMGSLMAGGLVVFGWSRAADALTYDRAVAGAGWSAAGAAAGLVAVGVVLASRRSRLARYRHRLLAGSVPANGHEIPARTFDAKVAIAVGGLRYHRPDCPAVGSVRTRLVQASRAGARQPCGICHSE
jgi:hypothetical protein